MYGQNYTPFSAQQTKFAALYSITVEADREVINNPMSLAFYALLIYNRTNVPYKETT